MASACETGSSRRGCLLQGWQQAERGVLLAARCPGMAAPSSAVQECLKPSSGTQGHTPGGEQRGRQEDKERYGPGCSWEGQQTEQTRGQGGVATSSRSVACLPRALRFPFHLCFWPVTKAPAGARTPGRNGFPLQCGAAGWSESWQPSHAAGVYPHPLGSPSCFSTRR